MISLCGVWNLLTVWFQESAFCRVFIFLSGIYLYTAINKRNALLFILVFGGINGYKLYQRQCMHDLLFSTSHDLHHYDCCLSS